MRSQQATNRLLCHVKVQGILFDTSRFHGVHHQLLSVCGRGSLAVPDALKEKEVLPDGSFSIVYTLVF